MTQNNNSWRKTYFTLLAGQAISFISSGILGNVKEVMEIRLRSKLKSVLIVHYLKILYNRNCRLLSSSIIRWSSLEIARTLNVYFPGARLV